MGGGGQCSAAGLALFVCAMLLVLSCKTVKNCDTLILSKCLENFQILLQAVCFYTWKGFACLLAFYLHVACLLTHSASACC